MQCSGGCSRSGSRIPTPIMRASRAISIPCSTQLIDERAMVAFADKYGFLVSKRLIDAEISQIPGTKGLNGEFSEQAYLQFLSQQQLTDARGPPVHLRPSLLQRLMLTPVATDVRVPVGMATPYASMLLEAREGEAAIVPIDRLLGRAQADRRGPPELLCRQPRPLHDPRAARAAHRPDRPGAGRGRRRDRPGNRGLLQRQPGALRGEGNAQPEPGGRPRPGDRRRHRRAGQGRRDACRRRGPGGRQCRGDLAAQPEPPGLCLGRRRQGRGGGVRGGFGSGRRAGAVGLRLGRGESRLGQRAKRQVACPGAAPKSPPSSPPPSARPRSRTCTTGSRTGSTTARISPRPRPRPSCRSRPRR